MRVLVIGQGGREHAICWKLRQSALVQGLYCAPGNPGIAEVAERVPVAVDDLQGLISFVRGAGVDFTIVGPEAPLALGIVDLFQAAGLRIFGPTQSAARLEGSKEFAKQVMHAAGVPTADYAAFPSEAEAWEHLRRRRFPAVIKADGLAAGKGVFICRDQDEARDALKQVFSSLGQGLAVIEDFLEGQEASYIVATDGERVFPFPASHDYKRIRDRDEGPNTGGMGTVSPTPHLTPQQEAWVLEQVIVPVLQEMRSRGIPLRGFLYAGLMIAPDGGIRVLEFNTRLGDPETQVIMRRMRTDLAKVLAALVHGTNLPVEPDRSENAAAVCVVTASNGYPERSSRGDVITGLEAAAGLEDVVIFHAGTALDAEGRLVTSGGRVLNVTASGENIPSARRRAYEAVDLVKYEGMQFRRDIAA